MFIPHRLKTSKVNRKSIITKIKISKKPQNTRVALRGTKRYKNKNCSNETL